MIFANRRYSLLLANELINPSLDIIRKPIRRTGKQPNFQWRSLCFPHNEVTIVLIGPSSGSSRKVAFPARSMIRLETQAHQAVSSRRGDAVFSFAVSLPGQLPVNE